MMNILNEIFKVKDSPILMFSDKNPKEVGYSKLTSYKCDKRYLYTCNLEGKIEFTFDKEKGEIYVKKLKVI